jgi:hypothetical protein
MIEGVFGNGYTENHENRMGRDVLESLYLDCLFPHAGEMVP